MSGGTENTKYYVSALVKDDGGIATNTGYRKQALRSNLDQELGGGFQLQVNMSGTHSTRSVGFPTTTTRQTSPFLVFPVTPNFVDLQPTQVADDTGHPDRFPDQPIRAQQSAPDLHVPDE